MDLDSQPGPLSKLISLVSQKWSTQEDSNNSDSDTDSEDSDFDSEFMSILGESVELEPEPELMSLIHQILSLVVSMDNFKWEKLISLCPQVQVKLEVGKSRFHMDEEVQTGDKWLCLPLFWQKLSLSGEEYTHFHCYGCKGKNHKENEEAPVEIKHPLHLKHSLQLVSKEGWRTRDCCCCDKFLKGIFYYCSACDYAMNIAYVYKPQVLYDLESESMLISFIAELIRSLEDTLDVHFMYNPMFVSLIPKIISGVISLNLASQPRPESKLVSLVKQTTILFNSTDLNSLPKPLLDLISITTQLVNYEDLDLKFFKSVMLQTLELKPEPELLSFIYQILTHVCSIYPKWGKLISISPQVKIEYVNKKFHVQEEVLRRSNNKWRCFPEKGEKFRLTGEEPTHFRCGNCNGEDHKEYEEVPACDFAMRIACVERPPKLSIDHPKWHEHTLALFPSQASFPCNLCALIHSTSCSFYICPPCDFVVHRSCLKLPHVIRISRHPHRISFTHSFQKGEWFCGVCRKKVDNDYGGYFCIKNGCSYAAHSKCATQRNVWDGNDLEGEPEEIEEEVEPLFVRISDGIIRHFSHDHHHLRLDENKDRNYDEDKLCQACITPIYFSNFYSCVECEYILHETCAKLSRKIHSPIHPHMLNLVERNTNVKGWSRNTNVKGWSRCSACYLFCTAGFFYECNKGEECRFQLHVQCATISEPLVNGSHIHPLFLTSKPGEQTKCSVCRIYNRFDTFNCIESKCEFALCFKCATIPEEVRYKHDKHTLTLSYGDHQETSTMMNWCEACEGQIDPKERFYKCDEYCCVTLHIKCLIGEDLYMKPDSCLLYRDKKISVLPNNQHMSRPFCSYCKKRCPHKIVFQKIGSIFCSEDCLVRYK